MVWVNLMVALWIYTQLLSFGQLAAIGQHEPLDSVLSYLLKCLWDICYL